jgi:hypothetical protein
MMLYFRCLSVLHLLLDSLLLSLLILARFVLVLQILKVLLAYSFLFDLKTLCLLLWLVL